jgi:hypothetical protein
LSPLQTAPALRQPMAFMLVQLISAVVVFGVTTGWIWLRADVAARDWFTPALPRMVGTFLGGLVFALAVAVGLVHRQRERYRIACFRPSLELLVVFALLSVLFGQAWRLAGTGLGAHIYVWLQTLEWYALWAALYSCMYSLVGAACACGLPLWVVLRFARERSLTLTADEPAPVPAWQVAFAIALWAFALYLKLAGTVLLGLPAIYVQPVDWLYLFISGLPAFGVIWMAIQTRLPREVARFSAGRVLLTGGLLALLWSAMGVALVFLVPLGVDNKSSSDALLLLLLLLWQASAWPLARWSLRWCFTSGEA